MPENSEKLTNLLDDIEDARSELKRYRNGLFYGWGSVLVGLFLVFIAGVLFSFDLIYWLALSLNIVGYVGSFCALVFCVLWVLFGGDSNPAKTLRKAERAHRNYTMKEANK